MKEYRFQAEVLKHEGMDAAYIMFPYNVEEVFGTKGQVKVKAVFDETVEYRGSLAIMGMACHALGMTQSIRKQLRKQPGDSVHVLVTADDAPRTATVPEELTLELQKHGVKSLFLELSYSNQKKLADSIAGAKKQETKVKRIANVIRSLMEKQPI